MAKKTHKVGDEAPITGRTIIEILHPGRNIFEVKPDPKKDNLWLQGPMAPTAFARRLQAQRQ